MMKSPVVTFRDISRAAVFVALATLVPTATATQRYAAPAGAGTACTDSAPCQVEVAVEDAGDGDEVIVLPGEHQVILPFSAFANSLTIRGADNQPRPTIAWGGLIVETQMLRVFGANSVIRDLVMRGNIGTIGGLETLLTGNGTSSANTTLERVLIDQTGNGIAVIGAQWNVRNSVLRSTSGNGAILSGTLTNSTIVAPAAERYAVRVSSGFDSVVTNLVIRNSILRGGPGAGGADLITDTAGQPTRTATANVDYSAFGAGRLRSEGPGTTTITAGPNNVLTSPLLVDLAGGTDVHQLPGSPTIDRGDPASVQGVFDFEGEPRVIVVPDIGADEYIPPPVAVTGPPTAVTRNGATLNGTVTTFSRPGTYRFEYGTTTAYGVATADMPVAASVSATAVSAAIAGLSPGTVYHVRVVAITDRGTAQGPDLTFTTQALPAAPALGRLTVTPKRVVTNRPVTIRFSLTATSRVSVLIERFDPGRRRAGRCRLTARTGKRCVRITTRGTVRRDLVAATSARFAIPGKVGGSRLRPGTYRLTVSATDEFGQRSNLRRIIVTVR